MSDSQAQSVQPPAPPAKGLDPVEPDPLAGLYHMSNTAGVTTQDYLAINPTAIASVLMAFASVLVFFNDMLLVLPAVGVVCALVAMHQIRHSNQTQTGRGLAILGLVLCLIVGGGKGGYDLVNALRTTADERAIAAVTQQFGQDLVARDYEQAYQRFDEPFRERVLLSKFVEVFKSYNDVPQLGTLQSVTWNGHRMEIEEKASGVVNAYEMAMFKFTGISDPRRIVFQFQKYGDTWRLHDLPAFFPPPKKNQQ